MIHLAVTGNCPVRSEADCPEGPATAKKRKNMLSDKAKIKKRAEDGGRHLAAGEYEKAVEEFSAVIDADPENSSALMSRARAYVKLRKRSPALADYTRVIEIDPENAPAFHERGRVLRRGKMYDRAISDYTREIGITPRSSPAYNSRGVCHTAKKDYDRAIEDFTRAVELDPGHALAYYNRGVCYRRKGLSDRAAADFEKYRQLEPGGKHAARLDEMAIMDTVKSSNRTKCPSCGKGIKITARFCDVCGFDMKKFING